MQEARLINVPIKLLQRCKDDKTSLEMLAIAIIIKQAHTDSKLYNISTGTFKKLFGVCYYKAKSLIAQCKESDLFDYNANHDFLRAKSFKDKTEKEFKHGKYRGTSDFVVKISLTGSLKEMVRLLRELLIFNAVNAKERISVKSHRGNSLNPKDVSAEKAITVRQMGSCMGMSKTSALRYIKRLEQQGKISKGKSTYCCVIPFLNPYTAERYIKITGDTLFFAMRNFKQGCWQGWKKIGCIYSILKREISDSFKHVIYNHKKRTNGGNLSSSHDRLSKVESAMEVFRNTGNLPIDIDKIMPDGFHA